MFSLNPLPFQNIDRKVIDDKIYSFSDLQKTSIILLLSKQNINTKGNYVKKLSILSKQTPIYTEGFHGNDILFTISWDFCITYKLER
jgi:hypothetical protein